MQNCSTAMVFPAKQMGIPAPNPPCPSIAHVRRSRLLLLDQFAVFLCTKPGVFFMTHILKTFAALRLILPWRGYWNRLRKRRVGG
jgi:hypothetical protein